MNGINFVFISKEHTVTYYNIWSCLDKKVILYFFFFLILMRNVQNCPASSQSGSALKKYSCKLRYGPRVDSASNRNEYQESYSE
jgi:hypothetical protein